jgi:hypothetical protein
MDQITNAVDTTVLECVFSLNRAKIKTGMAIQQLRTTNPVVNFICTVVEICSSAITTVIDWLCFNRKEPKRESWVSSYYYNRQKVQSHEEYHVFDDASLQTWPSSEFQEMFCEKYREFSEIYKSSDSPTKLLSSVSLENDSIPTLNIRSGIAQSIVLAKICPELVRIKLSANANPEEDVASLQVSNVSFLSVTYCVKNVGKLSIDIPKSHYVIGNELLSIGYVTRYLDYLPIYANWYFDGEYVLYIVDNDFHSVEINEKQWIRLTETGYEIESIQTPVSDSGLSDDDDEDDTKEAFKDLQSPEDVVNPKFNKRSAGESLKETHTKMDDSSSDDEEEEEEDQYAVLVGLLSSKPKID